MALSSGGWAPSPVPASSQSLHGGGPSLASCNTVLMSPSACSSAWIPAGRASFRLALRDTSGNRSSVFITEFDLRSVQYEVKSPRSHEMLANITAHELDDRRLHTAAAIEQWSTASLPLTEELCLELTRAIEAGDTQSASQHASSLARQKASLLSVAVEDMTSSCCVTVKVLPHMTVAALKQQVFVEYGFHPRVQRWVIGQCCARSPGRWPPTACRRTGTRPNLYLVSARQARTTRQMLQHQDQESAALLGPPPPPGPRAPARLEGLPARCLQAHTQQPG
ncbi:hypothetical protein CRUP_014733 [Coryphaenoides rupestris]|nr:hypothetical protein CRUP_014733 [Coryphaenoides rupestris]